MFDMSVHTSPIVRPYRDVGFITVEHETLRVAILHPPVPLLISAAYGLFSFPLCCFPLVSLLPHTDALPRLASDRVCRVQMYNC